jgi:hypothetical protein
VAVRREREIGRLFRLPIEEFVGARNELAVRLKRDGDADGAEAVRKLPKPTVAVWAVNQLADREKAGVRALLAAGTSLRKAQEATLAGRGSRDALREAQAKERAAVQELTQRAREFLGEANRAASAATLERVATTLGAAAVDDEARDALKAGRLTAELEPAGFGALAGFDLPAPESRSQAGGVRDELAERRAKKLEAQRRKRELQKQVRELEAEAREAERGAERAEAAAEDARGAADQARAAADQAAAELAEL